MGHQEEPHKVPPAAVNTQYEHNGERWKGRQGEKSKRTQLTWGGRALHACVRTNVHVRALGAMRLRERKLGVSSFRHTLPHSPSPALLPPAAGRPSTVAGTAQRSSPAARQEQPFETQQSRPQLTAHRRLAGPWQWPVVGQPELDQHP